MVPVIIEDRDGELTLKPAAVLEIERHSERQIADWDREDELSAEERQRILKHLQATRTAQFTARRLVAGPMCF